MQKFEGELHSFCLELGLSGHGYITAWERCGKQQSRLGTGTFFIAPRINT